MRKFDFQNIVDTTETINSLQLGPSIQRFPLPSPLPRLTSRFSRPSLIPQIATRRNQGCTKFLSSCGRPASYAGGPLANRQAFCTQRAMDPVNWLVARISPSCKECWICTLPQSAACPFFYSVSTPFWRVKYVGVKRRAKTG